MIALKEIPRILVTCFMGQTKCCIVAAMGKFVLQWKVRHWLEEGVANFQGADRRLLATPAWQDAPVLLCWESSHRPSVHRQDRVCSNTVLPTATDGGLI